jgi:WD40 repeat protein
LPNGYLASASYLGLIESWNVEEGFITRTLKSSTNFTGGNQLFLQLLQDRFLAIATTDGRIEIWNANEGYLLKSIQVTDEDDIFSLASFKNGTLVVAMWDGILILDPFTEEKVIVSTRLVSSLVLLDNNLLATLSGLYNFINILNITTGNVVRYLSLGGHTKTVSIVILLPNGFLASGSFDNTLKIWDPYKGILIKTLEGHESVVLSLALTKNDLLASSGDNLLKSSLDPQNAKLFMYCCSSGLF